MATLANAYRVIDDYGASAGPTGGQTGATSGMPLAVDFQAQSLANAAQLAYLISSIFQRPVRLVAMNQFGVSPTLITGIGANTALTSVPSGISF